MDLLEVGVVLVLVLVKLLQPTRCRARERWTRGGTPTSTTSVFGRWGGVAREDQGTTKGTFEVQVSVHSLAGEPLTRSAIVTIKSSQQRTAMTSYLREQS